MQIKGTLSPTNTDSILLLEAWLVSVSFIVLFANEVPTITLTRIWNPNNIVT